MTDNFIHLRVKSSYSLLASVLKIDHIVNLAAQHNMPAVALTDYNNLFALLEFSTACTKANIQPICGASVNISYEHENQQKFAEILILAKDDKGYQNLLKLVSTIYLENERKTCDHITIGNLIAHNEGLIVLSGYDKGIIGQLIYEQDYEKAKYYAKYFQDIFKDRFYFEIMRHGTRKQIAIETKYIQLSNELDIALVATNEALFPSIKEHDKHDTLLCIAQNKPKEDSNRNFSSNQCYFKSHAEMAELFSDLPAAIQNSYNISKRCYVMAKSNAPQLPNFAPMGVSEESILRDETKNALKIKLASKFQFEDITDANEQAEITQIYEQRLNYELEVICKMQFAGYFLIVSDFIKWSKQNSIAVGPGRGSVVGSIVAWCLLITDLDPIEFGLLFERFLNPERVSMPDIDVDFCQERRDEVLAYVRQKYSGARVGHIITFGSMQAKAVIKDVARCYGLRFEIANYITDLVPFSAVNPVNLTQALEQVAELNNAYKGKGLFNLKLHDYEDAEQINILIKQILDNALTLEGLQRHVSMHAAGIVIAKEDLIKTVPLYKDNNNDNIIIQYSMKYAELAGLVKFDFLGLQTLTLISNTCKLLKQNGVIVDISNISLKDKKTFKLLASGKTNGVFQFESFGMKDSIKKIQPDTIDDLIALGALYRPGPMDNIPTYVACKHKKQQPDYLHPLLEPILRDTYGVIIYQEQVMEIAKVLGGYSLGSADLLRRAMGKKIKAEMDAQEQIFLKGAMENDIDPDQASYIFSSVAKFAGYGFNKSHAAGYGLISYQTAYLKANYVLEFLVACLNLDVSDQNKVNLFIHEARDNNIKILSPDINLSKAEFTIFEETSEKKILFGFTAIKAVSKNVGLYIQSENERKKFTNIFDFIERIPGKLLNKRSLENLILAGCFDKLHGSRKQLLASLELIMAHGSISEKEKQANQFSLMPNNYTTQKLKEIGEDFASMQKAEYEFDLLGVFLTYHPIEYYEGFLKEMGAFSSKKLANLYKGSSGLKIAGVIQKKDSRISDKGVFVSIQLSDNYGIFDVTIFGDKILETYGNLLEVKKKVLVTCEAYKDNTSTRLTVVAIEDLDELIGKTTGDDLFLTAYGDEHLKNILDFLQTKRDDNANRINIEIAIPIQNSPFAGRATINDQFNLSIKDIKQLKNI